MLFAGHIPDNRLFGFKRPISFRCLKAFGIGIENPLPIGTGLYSSIRVHFVFSCANQNQKFKSHLFRSVSVQTS
ncbi:hypothetical protein BN949_01665 [Agrobacterium tumefaciens]|nr:hypothetical protein BN949_01665 [Agrobacterium tumefaciens]